MIIHDVVQNSPAWDMLHIGRATASDFHKIITPVTGEYSKQARGFAYYKVAEAALNESLNTISGLEWIARGKTYEDEAASAYAFINDVRLDKVGFITTDSGHFGCSPDRVIWRYNRVQPPGGVDGEVTIDRVLAGLVEIKCPAPQTQVEYWAEGVEDAYRPQVQGQMWICEAEWNDFFSYHPRMPPVQKRIYRDPGYIVKLTSSLRKFDDLFQSLLARAKAEGFFDGRAAPATSIDKLAEELRDITTPSAF